MSGYAVFRATVYQRGKSGCPVVCASLRLYTATTAPAGEEVLPAGRVSSTWLRELRFSLECPPCRK